MWLALAFVSAFFVGCYDISKKLAVDNNAVLPVLFFTTLFCTILLLPLVLISAFIPDALAGTIFFVPAVSFETHAWIFVKSVIVLISWILGYYAISNLPLTITGPVNATRPVMTLLLAMPLFGETLNLYQWAGVLLTVVSLFLLSSSGKKEGIDFAKNKWIYLCFLAALTGSANELYDKFLMQRFSPTSVQFWFNFYQCLLMAGVVMVLWPPRRKNTTRFTWRWSIILISILLVVSDFVYYYALTDPDAMISVMSMIRRGSVLVSFAGGVLFFHERNLKAKIIDLVLIFAGMFFLYLGSQ